MSDPKSITCPTRTEQPRKSDVTGREIPSGTETECANFKPEQPEAPKMSAREPDGYAYRYGDGFIRFTNGEPVNGGKPVESIPYFLGYASHSQPPAEVDYERLRSYAETRLGLAKETLAIHKSDFNRGVISAFNDVLEFAERRIGEAHDAKRKGEEQWIRHRK